MCGQKNPQQLAQTGVMINQHNIPMKNSNQQPFSIASLNCLTLASSSLSSHMIALSTFPQEDATDDIHQLLNITHIGRKTYQISRLTLELYLKLTINKFISTKDLPKTTPPVGNMTSRMTERKAVVVVGFLWVVVRANLVNPKSNWFPQLILKTLKVESQSYSYTRKENIQMSSHVKNVQNKIKGISYSIWCAQLVLCCQLPNVIFNFMWYPSTFFQLHSLFQFMTLYNFFRNIYIKYDMFSYLSVRVQRT